MKNLSKNNKILLNLKLMGEFLLFIAEVEMDSQ